MITITNSGADTFVSDGGQNPSFNKNFIAGLSKATVVSNPLTAGLDSILIMDNAQRGIIVAYADITDINGSTPITLGLTDAQEVATYLNNNFFKFGETGITSVTTASPLTGDGVGNPVTFAAGVSAGQFWFWNGSAWELTNAPTKSGQIAVWNGTDWTMIDAPSYNLLARRSVQTFTFEGGFGLAGGGINGNVLIGTSLQRNSPNVSMLSPSDPNRRPIVQNIGSAGSWIKLWTTATAGNLIRINETTTSKFYYRETIRYTNAAFPGSFRIGFINAPANTVLDGFGAEIIAGNIRAFCNSGASFTYGANFAIVDNAWYDVECLYEYTGGNMVCKLYVNGVLVSTATRAVASFSGDCSIGIFNATGAATGIIHSDLIEYSIY